jgi:hypothetical protein
MTIKKNQIANQVVSNSVIPLPVPADPGKWICVTMMIPDSLGHRAAFLGAISNLATWRVWQRDLDHNGTIVAELWKKARRSVRFVDCNPTPPPVGIPVEINLMADLFFQLVTIDGVCRAQIKCCIEDPWTTLANLSDLISNPPGTGKQPAPGGGTSSDCFNIAAIDGRVVPVKLSTGDQITVDSAVGNWGDGSLAQYCVDGNTFFVECIGSGATVVGGSDVVPTAPHMSLVVRFSTGYFPLYPGGTLTVPSGITNEEPFFLANKPTLNSGNGGQDVCMTFQNNQTAPWSKDFDFTSAPGPFAGSAMDGTGWGASWVAGIGWVASGGNACAITAAVPVGTHYLTAIETATGTPTVEARITDADNATAIVLSPANDYTVTTHVRLACLCGTPNSTISRLQLTGKGTPPF